VGLPGTNSFPILCGIKVDAVLSLFVTALGNRKQFTIRRELCAQDDILKGKRSHQGPIFGVPDFGSVIVTPRG
jgi:hypothetical protein